MSEATPAKTTTATIDRLRVLEAHLADAKDLAVVLADEVQPPEPILEDVCERVREALSDLRLVISEIAPRDDEALPKEETPAAKGGGMQQG